MKKMMTLLAAVLVAGITQAAVINWQSGNMYLPTSAEDGTWGTTTKLAAGQATGYFFILDAVTYNDANLIADVTSGMMAGTYDLSSPDNTVLAAGALNRAINWTYQGAYNVGDSGYMLVVYEMNDYLGKDWFMVAKGTATIGTGGLDETVGSMASSIGEWTAVPEPTSMALLAFGVAALGLRRKFRA